MGKNTKEKVAFWGTLAATLGIVASPFIYSYHIKNNLEEGAVHCGPYATPMRWDTSSMLPGAKNSELDNNGKYESIFIYENKTGQKFYKEFRMNQEGELTFGKEMPFR